MKWKLRYEMKAEIRNGKVTNTNISYPLKKLKETKQIWNEYSFGTKRFDS